MVDIKTHPELYRLGNAISASNYAAGIEGNVITNKVIHYYWWTHRPFERKQSLALKACVATQGKAEINLWSNENLSDNIWLSDIKKYINFKIYNPRKEAVGTILEGNNKILSQNDNSAWLDGDLFRLLILYKYGGLYCDCDMVLLRDVSPLLTQEFMIQWGSSPDRQNGAIMYLRKESDLAEMLLRKLLKTKPVKNSNSWGSELYKKVWKKHRFAVLPGGFFNPEWQDSDKKKPFEPFKGKIYEMYKGSFGWHWHNRWDESITTGSKWGAIEAIIDRWLQKCT